MSFVWAFLLVLVSLVSWVLTVIGLPGNWIALGAAAGYAYIVPEDSAVGIGWNVVWIVAGLAVLGEIVEFLAGMAGAAKAGASKRSSLLALFGSMVGGFAGLFVGIPIPVVGQIVAAVLFSGLGAFAGAWMGEAWKGREMEGRMAVGRGAFIGTILGTLAKVLIGLMIVVVIVLGLIF